MRCCFMSRAGGAFGYRPRVFFGCTVARGPVPRDRCMARDRPSPYGEKGRSWSRSAGACPPRSLDLPTSVVRERPLPNGSRAGVLVLQRYTAAELKKFFHVNDRGGQAPALREKKRAVYRRARALACHTRIREGSPRHANRLKQDLHDYHDFTGLGLWCIGAVVASHGGFDASASIIVIIL